MMKYILHRLRFQRVAAESGWIASILVRVALTSSVNDGESPKELRRIEAMLKIDPL